MLDHEEILSQDYCALLVRAYEEASNGQFSPTDVSFDRQKRGPARLSFRAAGTEFSRSFPYEFGTVESAVHDLVNEALGAAGSPYRFFQLPGADVMGVALVRPKVFEQASHLGLLRTSWWGGEAAQRRDAPDGALN